MGLADQTNFKGAGRGTAVGCEFLVQAGMGVTCGIDTLQWADCGTARVRRLAHKAVHLYNYDDIRYILMVIVFATTEKYYVSIKAS